MLSDLFFPEFLSEVLSESCPNCCLDFCLNSGCGQKDTKRGNEKNDDGQLCHSRISSCRAIFAVAIHTGTSGPKRRSWMIFRKKAVNYTPKSQQSRIAPQSGHLASLGQSLDL